MVFSSYTFVFFFLPVTLAVFWVLDRQQGARARLVWLFGASLFFYGWWNPVYVPLLIGSIVFNFLLGRLLERRSGSARRGWLLGLGVGANLGLLGVFKYAALAAESANALLGAHLPIPRIVLPLAISFFTFQQISFLVDASRGRVEHHGLLSYAVFVSFFPQLIAGPIVRQDETLPQIDSRRRRLLQPGDLAVGATIFIIGLFKKAVLADTIARFANPVFDGPEAGLTLLAAWGGALAYALQIYFDFSGYSDMAIGGARLFGIKLPENFATPYGSASVIEFWRRWHMTLSRFLRDYLYFPLGGNRKGTARRYLNLMLTMLLGGLWHGAAWTFVLWGGLHGLFLLVNHGWRALRAATGFTRSTPWGRVLARVVTFTAVLGAWVLFRAEDLGVATRVYQGMLGWHGLAPSGGLGLDQVLWTSALLVLACTGPNTQEWMEGYDPVLVDPRDSRRRAMLAPGLRWRPSPRWAVVSGLLALAAISLLERTEEFLYFQF